MPILNQSSTAIDAVTETVTAAIDSGSIGIAVLLAVGLIVLGVLMGLLIWKVVVPLLKQAIEVSSQVGVLIQRTNAAIEHSNVTNTLQTEATNVQTGFIQGMDKNIVKVVDEFKVLTRSFGDYQIANTDTISGFRLDLDAFKTEVITHVQQLMTISEANSQKHDAADVERVEIKKMLGEILTLVNNIKPPTAPIQAEVTIMPSPTPIDELPKASGQ